jgi:hypothetical protein
VARLPSVLRPRGRSFALLAGAALAVSRVARFLTGKRRFNASAVDDLRQEHYDDLARSALRKPTGFVI